MTLKRAVPWFVLFILASVGGCAVEDDHEAAANSVVVQPDALARGAEAAMVVLLVDVDPTVYLASASLGADVDLLRFDPCSDGAVPEGFDRTDPFQVCAMVSVGETADLGPRPISIELEIGGDRITATGTLSVTE